MHQTTLPRGKQIATDPHPDPAPDPDDPTGTTAVDAGLAGAVPRGVAEAAGAAIVARGKAIAVAAMNLLILLDIFVPSISSDWFDARAFQPTSDVVPSNRRAAIG
ncbi:hypothetical protein ACFZC5_18420 [Nocardia gamkensis]|jgi:hypothetical protein|uniref:hypothetical protein n=1 Tax=Nocardia gamkensis TaxID=352869 RepID=UPI0036E8F85C